MGNSKRLQNSPKASYEGIPTWFNTENPMAITYPRAIIKLMKWSKDNPDKKSTGELAEGTGYTADEIHVMLDYFLKKTNKQIKEMDEMIEKEKVMDMLLDFMGNP